MDWLGLSRSRSDASKDRKKEPLIIPANRDGLVRDVSSSTRQEVPQQMDAHHGFEANSVVDTSSNLPPASIAACETALELQAVRKSAVEMTRSSRRRSEVGDLLESPRRQQAVTFDEGFVGFYANGIMSAAETAAEAVLQGTSHPPIDDVDAIAPDCIQQCAEDDIEIPSKIPAEGGVRGKVRRLRTFLLSQGCIYSTIFAVMASGLVFGMAKQLNLLPNIDWDQDINVAFIGNSYLVVNDVPRVLVSLSNGLDSRHFIIFHAHLRFLFN